MFFRRLLMLALLCALCNSVENARILGVFPSTSPSHYILGNALMRGLAEAGHNVTVVSPFEEKNPPNKGSYKDVILTGFREEFDQMMQAVNLFENKKQSSFSMLYTIFGMLSKIYDKFFSHENVQTLLNSDETFDVVIVEQFLNDAMKVFGHIYNAPVIVVSTMGANAMVNNIVGNPSPLSYIPQFGAPASVESSFTARIFNVYSYVMFQAMDRFIFFPHQSRILKQYFPDAPDIYDLYHNVSLVLLNSHESFNQPIPTVPNMVQIGGYHIKPPKKLPKDLQEYLDDAKEGVVYFSLGSNLKSKNLPPNKRDAFLKAFGKLKEKVLCKWEDDLPGKPPNVKLSKWLPQQDILAHPNVKLFITHNGLLSTIEAVYHGVPILGIPVFADQHQNAKLATLNGYALSLPFEDPSFSEEKLSELLQELLTNPKYTENVKRRSQLFHDRPLKPMDAAVYWVEYVIRTGGAPHLRVAGARIPWFKYQSLDVISFIAVVTFLVVCILYITIRKILKCISGGVKSKSKKE